MGAEYTLPNISPSAVCIVEGKGGGAAQRWYVVWSHVRTTSGLTEQEATEAHCIHWITKKNGQDLVIMR